MQLEGCRHPYLLQLLWLLLFQHQLGSRELLMAGRGTAAGDVPLPQILRLQLRQVLNYISEQDTGL